MNKLFLIGIIALFFVGCSEHEEVENVPAGIVLTETDYTTGILGGVGESTYGKLLSPISSDAGVVVQNNEIYVLEKMESNVMKVAEDGKVIYQKRIKPSWNAHDLVVLDETKGYICSNNYDEIAIFNPSTGDVSSYLSLSVYGNDSVTTNATKMILDGTDLYVACQMRKGYEPHGGTLILKINTLTDVVDETIRCTYKNVIDFDYSDGALYVTNGGSFFAVDGAVEKIDLATNTITTLVTGESLGFDINEIAIDATTNTVYGSLYKAWGDVPVMKYSLADFALLGSVPDVIQATSLTFSNGYLYFGETGGTAGGTAGVAIYNPEENSVDLTPSTLAPSSIALLK